MSVGLDLNTVWFVLVGVLLTGYAMLDGFDLGVGILHLRAKSDEHRRIFLNAIGPVWDGNEVWLVTGGGALFAAFPLVYASAFSGFYTAFMLLLVALIFRAVAIEFRSKRAAPAWRRAWDVGFSAGSLLSTVLVGLALGNVIWGLPLDDAYHFQGPLLSLLHPYALLVAATTVALFAMHGAIYLVMKTEGELQQQVAGWVRPTIIAFVLTLGLTTMATLLYVPHMTEAIRHQPALFLVPAALLLAVANVPREIHLGREFRAFLSSCAAIVAMMALVGIGMYPNMLHARPAAENSLTIYNAASSPTTLTIMLVIALIGVPLVLAYTASIYWVFRGKVKLDAHSY
jgi:cytochrome bd ubiquinol oxidase subunit II